MKAIRLSALGAKQGQRLGEMFSALPAPGSAPGQMQWAPLHPPSKMPSGASQSPLGIKDRGQLCALYPNTTAVTSGTQLTPPELTKSLSQ